MLPKNACLRHVALAVHKLDDCEQFYNLLGMHTELKTDDYAYLTGNGDNISLHKLHATFEATQRLEHIGFALDSIQGVDQLFHNLKKHGFNIAHPPKTFGIGTHSFSVFDPDGIKVEFTYHPPMWVKQ
ncbi:Metallothiol transferase FosB [Legionella nautarum]|uniref:Metallothiol transferase FosB n=1 Tax=Legionella nautarum TaxID=45070 RepID=A0A0W0WW30_9GAMM|nr:VOC family protein [Legionella nautarum]KTD36526.1 Metallothiol transferase FosB [Legionella nautarum]